MIGNERDGVFLVHHVKQYLHGDGERERVSRALRTNCVYVRT